MRESDAVSAVVSAVRAQLQRDRAGRTSRRHALGKLRAHPRRRHATNAAKAASARTAVRQTSARHAHDSAARLEPRRGIRARHRRNRAESHARRARAASRHGQRTVRVPRALAADERRALERRRHARGIVAKEALSSARNEVAANHAHNRTANGNARRRARHR